MIWGNWNREQMPNEDFFTHFEFAQDSNCTMNNHLGNVHAMTYGVIHGTYLVKKQTITIKPSNSGQSSQPYTLTYKISKEKNTDPESALSPIYRMELKNLKTGKSYLFYKIDA